ncbi:MAG: DUF2520 domain-containing protein [Bacteroidetes bacterium]|jgi:predicted short-subunit dehydrogenase-like oxidoreductase (DUF2520 family)|nr:DUF2520 domain-containing protein [Bacteroidota bacterium]MBT3749108.1 DUF2520 domain-containing protein [Bacteroidota bacterium]MBT4399695.1 DUF2520 domain-containing protein [Bacteroidota bacterium]MBT4409900.1 DUF2520 domain-containing protein [Bacteroidota bacterium]MBT5425742.1 DUF2520 domain-containing protein [Bacteroidota bacterium]
MTNYKIVIIGAGAVGTRLGMALFDAGHQIVQVISRQYKSAESLAQHFGSVASTNVADLDQNADLVFLTVPDSVLPQLLASFPDHKSILVHTSGSFPIEKLAVASEQYGVFYPLQTFSKDRKLDFSKLPLLVEACNDGVCQTLLNLGEQLSTNVQIISSSDRRQLHVAAIFVCNFVNYLVGCGELIAFKAGVSRETLIPLIMETMDKSVSMGSADAQTGPARRGDFETIKKHLDLLSCCPEEKHIYQILTKAILARYGHEL